MEITHKDLENLEKRIGQVFNKRFEMHERTEMVIYDNLQKILDKHDNLLIGVDGNGGIKEDISEIEKNMIGIKTRIKVWSGIFGMILGGGGITVFYMVITGP